MSTKKPRNEILEAVRVASLDEAKAVEFLEHHRWGDSPGCPREGCGSMDVYRMRDAETGERNKDFRWRCRTCKKMFSVRTNTVLEETRLPLRRWLHCYWRAIASKKGVSALQISRECEISYKSSLFLMHRLRQAMTDLSPNRPKLTGVVEADETYVGGKPRYRQSHDGPKIRAKWSDRVPVLGVIQRGGEVRFQVSPHSPVKAVDVQQALVKHVEPTAKLITDESPAYTTIGYAFEGGHETVAHKAREYARGDVHSNTIEGAFSLLKRGVYGTFHHVSPKHLHRYVAEFEFRHNTRRVDDGQRLAMAIKASAGKRLTYRQQVAG